MNIIIDDSICLSDIQKDFTEQFPCLRLQFFAYETDGSKVFLKDNVITDSNKKIGEIRHFRRPGSINLNGNMKVANLEKKFGTFGINVQVYRRAGANWIQTNATDNWSLSVQNKTGMETTHHLPEPVSEIDYHEQE